MRRGAAVIAVVVVACGGGGDASRDAGAVGSLEYVEVDVSSLVPARVVTVRRNEGEIVRAGDTLVVLTQSTTRSDIDARRARLAAAEAVVRDLEAGARSAEIETAEAQLRAATAETERADREVARLTPLARGGTVSQQALDAAQTAARTSIARRDAAAESLRLLRAGARPNQIAAARADAATARATLDAAIKAAGDLVLVAPVGGTVLSRNVEPGEILAAGVPAMTLGDVTRPYVRVFVDQATLPTIAVGSTATATLDAFPEKRFTGRVASISTRAEFTPRVALTKDERADLMYAVRVEISDTTGMLKAGLPVTVRFR